MNKVKIVVVDDEEEAREGVKQLLESDTEIELLSVCKNGLEAIQDINQLKPDLVFIDIQMPEVNGFDVLNNIRIKPFPMVIFITAYDQYALKAFEIHAVDYLLKPFTDERFFKALNYAKTQVRESSIENIESKLSSILTSYQQDQGGSESNRLINENTGSGRMTIKSSGKIYFVPLDEIRWVEAFDYYIKIHVKDKFYLVRESMKKMEQKLPGEKFMRIHKSSIVNLEFINELEPHFNGEYLLRLIDGQQLKVSRSYRKNLDLILNDF